MQKKSFKTIFITQALGYGGKLLYWHKIFNGIAKSNQKLKVYNPYIKKNFSNTVVLDSIINLFSFKFRFGKALYHYNLNIISPFFLIKLAKEKPLKIIISEFSQLSLYVIFYSFFFTVKIVLLIENDPKFVQKKHSFFRILFRKFICKNVDLVIVNNQLGEKYCTDVLNIKKEKIYIKAYLTSFFDGSSSANLNLKNEICFLFVGQISRRKGIFQLMEAFKKIVAKNKDENIKLLAIGEGEEMQVIKEQYSELFMNNKVKFLGRIDYAEIENYFNKADVYINSTLGDYRALVGFEALSKSLPIIYSKFDGAYSEVIEDGKNGFLIDPNNIESIEIAIQNFISNRELISKFSSHSKKIASNFTTNKIVENWINIINI